MRHQEVAKKLDQMSAGFHDATNSLTQIFTDLKLIRQVDIPPQAPQCIKLAASAALVSETEQLMQEAANPDLITVATQLAKIGDKIRIALPGGAVLSSQERAWIKDPENAGKLAPPNLFYILAQEQLSTSAALKFDYASLPADTGFEASLKGNLRRELGEELGRQAADEVRLGSFLPGSRQTTLATLKLPDQSIATRIAEALADVGVTIDPQGTLHGIYTTVSERVAVGHAPLGVLARSAEDNTEAAGVRVRTLRDLLELSKKTAESEESYLNFRKLHGSTSNGYDGIRNPSTTWGLALLTEWIRDQVIAADGK